MIKHFCDRCGKEIPKNGQKTYVKVTDQAVEVPKGMKVEYELCMDCLDELKEFLDITTYRNQKDYIARLETYIARLEDRPDAP